MAMKLIIILRSNHRMISRLLLVCLIASACQHGVVLAQFGVGGKLGKDKVAPMCISRTSSYGDVTSEIVDDSNYD